METVYDLLGDLPDTARLRAPPSSLSAREVRTTAYRVGNYLRSRGVHEGSLVGVADDAEAKPVLAFLGASLLGAAVRFDPPREFDGRLVVAPTETLSSFDLPPGGQRVGYGSRPSDPAAGHFEGAVWSENPSFPPASFAGDPVALSLRDRGDGRTQRDLLTDAESFAATLDPAEVVAVRAPFAEPGALAGGVLAPLAAGATVLLPGDSDAVGTVAVVDDDTATAAGERRVVDADRLA